MFGSIGISELILIAGVALMVLGPDKFPEFAKMAARLFRDLRKYKDEVTRDLTKELKPMKKELEDLSKVNPEQYIDALIDDDDEDDDGTINLEPEFVPEDLYGAEEAEASTEPAAAAAPETPATPYKPYDDYPQEEDGFEITESTTEETPEDYPERLDG